MYQMIEEYLHFEQLHYILQTMQSLLPLPLPCKAKPFTRCSSLF